MAFSLQDFDKIYKLALKQKEELDYDNVFEYQEELKQFVLNNSAQVVEYSNSVADRTDFADFLLFYVENEIISTGIYQNFLPEFQQMQQEFDLEEEEENKAKEAFNLKNSRKNKLKNLECGKSLIELYLYKVYEVFIDTKSEKYITYHKVKEEIEKKIRDKYKPSGADENELLLLTMDKIENRLFLEKKFVEKSEIIDSYCVENFQIGSEILDSELNSLPDGEYRTETSKEVEESGKIISIKNSYGDKTIIVMGGIITDIQDSIPFDEYPVDVVIKPQEKFGETRPTFGDVKRKFNLS